MIRQIVAEERKKKNYPKMSRREKLRSVMLEANRRLMEIASDEDFYDTDIKGTADSSPGNFFAAYGAPLKSYQSKVVQELFADGKNDQGEAAPSLRSLEEDIRCSMLIPSQNVIGSKQSLSNVAFGGGYKPGDGFHMSADDDGGAAYVKGEGYKMFTNPVMAAKCKEGVMIIDGHHRWSQIMMLNPDAKVHSVILYGSDQISADDILQMVHVAIAEIAKEDIIGKDGKAPTEDVVATQETPGGDKIATKLTPKAARKAGVIADDAEMESETLSQISGGPFSMTLSHSGDNMLTKGTAQQFRDDIVAGLKSGSSKHARGSVPPTMVQWANGMMSSKDLADQTTGPGTGSKIPYAIAQKLGKDDITVDEFADFLKGNIERLQSTDGAVANAPKRDGMPQAGDTFGPEYSKKALDHIAANKISIATSEASWHKGEALNESRARWQKLAGILKD